MEQIHVQRHKGTRALIPVGEHKLAVGDRVTAILDDVELPGSYVVREVELCVTCRHCSKTNESTFVGLLGESVPTRVVIEGYCSLRHFRP